MVSAANEREHQQPTWHRERAAEHRRQAERLWREGYGDAAARHRLEARLHDLEAAATAASSRAA